jgi:hypothetical protein
MTKMHLPIPLHITGNITGQQCESLRTFLGAAADAGCEEAVQGLDRHCAQLVIDNEKKLKSEIAASVVEIVHRYAVSDKFKNEETPSRREYPSAYRVRPVEAQVTELRKTFPSLGTCVEKLGRRPLPQGAEAWFAVPRWQVLAPTYSEAVEMIVGALASRRRFSNRIPDAMGPAYLRQSDRTELAERMLAEQQPCNDILVVAAQAGIRHRGLSPRRARVVMEGNEFGLGAFAVGCMLLTHPERLSDPETLMIDCAGDEYSIRGDGTFDRVPLFDYDLSGIEFSIFYHDRARNLWGTPSGLLFKM